jgi:tRNA 2-thiouridine synthesizing protein A
MSATKTLDVRGLSCPQPALQTKQTIRNMDAGIIEVMVDSKASRDNVTRLAQKAGWNVAVEEEPEGSFKLILRK